ncbi:2-hydroxyacid dehydrogenase [Rhizobium pusense]|uniref:2-hydroxyacid dehydrogenase n=1 Tax=Agrobacterium pusense TaxID=648995 RepID=UPI00244CC7C6|nr:2-hydroxyacid dehydrogenase [Agrobacterium pusense]MDH0873373.1 2-hydroxyacid dehydrogenase [Agrobacterium pusense]MDH2092493.1 2-hydroxyacid dehydrogenase [Agrobacterium pusense]
MTQRNIRVFVADDIPPWVMDRLGSQFRLTTHLAFDHDTRAIISGSDSSGNRTIDAGLLDRFPALEVIVGFGTGYDRIDVEVAWKRGITVTNTPNVHAEDVADFTVGLLITTLRQMPAADAFVRRGLWSSRPYPLLGESLQGKKVGIVGMGAIGKALARRLAAFNVDISYHGRNPQPNLPFLYHSSILSIARDVDILVLAIPGGPSTEKLVDASVLNAVGENGYLVNVSRGSVVCEASLLVALSSGSIKGAGLDVFAHEPAINPAFFSLENVVLQPHVASATTRTREAMWQLVIDNLISWADRSEAITPVQPTLVTQNFNSTVERMISQRG